MTSDHRTVGAIAAGGAIGTLARYEVAQLIHVAKGSFPWATFWTNVSGAFVLGAFVTLLVERFPQRHSLRALFGTGFLGAYTTFSTMAVETVTLAKDGDAVLGIVYLAVSIAVGLLAARLGVMAARSAAPRRESPDSC